jgi:hypothetical protein
MVLLMNSDIESIGKGDHVAKIRVWLKSPSDTLIIIIKIIKIFINSDHLNVLIHLKINTMIVTLIVSSILIIFLRLSQPNLI